MFWHHESYLNICKLQKIDKLTLRQSDLCRKGVRSKKMRCSKNRKLKIFVRTAKHSWHVFWLYLKHFLLLNIYKLRERMHCICKHRFSNTKSMLAARKMHFVYMTKAFIILKQQACFCNIWDTKLVWLSSFYKLLKLTKIATQKNLQTWITWNV